MKTLITLFLFVVGVYAFEKNPFFSTEQELENWFWDSTSTGTEKRLLFEMKDTTGGKAVWKIETRCFCELDWSVYVLYDWNNDSIICGHGLIAGIDFGGEESGGECLQQKIIPRQKKRAIIAIQHFIRKDFSEYLQKYVSEESSDYQKFKSGRESLYKPLSALYVVQGRYWRYIPITASNVTQYNDLGFFLEQGGKYREAIILLSEVIKAVPERTVAYLNLADAYWGLSDTTNARQQYCRYIELMKAGNLEKKIPARAKDRCSALK